MSKLAILFAMLWMWIGPAQAQTRDLARVGTTGAGGAPRVRVLAVGVADFQSEARVSQSHTFESITP